VVNVNLGQSLSAVPSSILSSVGQAKEEGPAKEEALAKKDAGNSGFGCGWPRWEIRGETRVLSAFSL